MANKKDMTFEQAMQKLEELVHALENEDVDLEKTIQRYEEGIEISKYCYERLNKAKQKLQKMEIKS